MEKDLMKFNEKLEKIGSKEVVQYQDENGTYILMPISQLFLSCEYIELEKEQLQIARFNGEIEKDADFNKIKVTKKKDKSEITKNKSDKGTIVDAEVEVSQVWVVRNGLKLSKAFNNKEEAISYCQEFNMDMLKTAELI